MSNTNNTDSSTGIPALLPIKNNGNNWVLWDNQLQDSLGLFGTAGEEISTNSAISRTEPSIPECMDALTGQVVDDSSSEAESDLSDDDSTSAATAATASTAPSTAAGTEPPSVSRQQRRAAQRAHVKLEKQKRRRFRESIVRAFWTSKALYDSNVKSDKASRGRLWYVLINSIEASLREKLDNEENFDEIRAKYNTLELYNLIKTKSSEIAQLSAQKLRNDWSHMRQKDTESLSAYLKRFKDKLKELAQAGEIIANKSKMFQLSQSLVKARYIHILADMFAMTQDSPDYPEFDAMCRRLQTYEDNTKHIKLASATPPLAKAEDTVKVFKVDSKPTRKERLQSRQRDSDEAKVLRASHKKVFAAKVKSATLCTNCLETGKHRSIECPLEPVTCEHCGNLGHMATHCRTLLFSQQSADTASGGLAKKPRSDNHKLPNPRNQIGNTASATARRNPSGYSATAVTGDHNRLSAYNQAVLTEQWDPAVELPRIKIIKWLDSYFGVGRHNIAKDFPELHSVPDAARSVPFSFLLQFWQQCHNGPQAAQQFTPTLQNLFANYMRPETLAPTGDHRVVVPTHHPLDIARGVYDRPTASYSHPLPFNNAEAVEGFQDLDMDSDGSFYEDGEVDESEADTVAEPRLPMVNSQQNPTVFMARNRTVRRNSSNYVLLDTCAGVHVERFIDNMLLYAAPNTDSSVALNGISGDRASLRVTHTGYHPVIGRFFIVPAADADLVSVAELMKKGFKVQLEDDSMIIDSPNGATGRAHINSANHYSMERYVYNELITPLVAPVAYLVEPTAPTAAQTPRRQRSHSLPNTAALRTTNSPAATAATLVDLTAQPVSVRFTKEQRERARQVKHLHNVCGHPSNKTLINALNNGLILGTALTARDVAAYGEVYGSCPACVAGKTTKPTYKPSTNEPATAIGDVVHVDIYILHEPSIGGYYYFLLCIDEFSGLMNLIPLVSKYHDDINACFYELKAYYTLHKHTLRKIQCDSESGFSACATFLRTLAIALSQVTPYQHAQRIERHVRTVNDRMRTILASLPYVLPPKLYGELLYTVINNINDLPTTGRPNITPRTLVEGTKMDLTKRILEPFGTLVMVHHAGKEQPKFLPKAEMGVFLGEHTYTYGALRTYVFESESVVVRSEYTLVNTFPEKFPWPLKRSSLAMTDTPVDTLHTLNPANRDIVTKSHKPVKLRVPRLIRRTLLTTTPQETQPTDTIHSHTTGNSAEAGALQLAAQPNIAALKPLSSNQEPVRKGGLSKKRHVSTVSEELTKQVRFDNSTYTDISTLSPISSPGPVRISGGGPSGPRPATEHTTEAPARPEHTTARKSLKRGAPQTTATDTALRRSGRTPVPKSWDDDVKRMNKRIKSYKVSISSALQGDRAQESREAIRDEILNMLNYKVGHYVKWEDIPPKMRLNILHSFMFLKHKEKPDGSYDKTKARMVGNGKNQGEHMYDFISSSTVALSTVFLLFNIASYHRAHLASYDIKGAFLNAQFEPTDETTYLKINREITAIWCEMDPSALPFVDRKGELILELDKFIYGLKQAPYKFQQVLNKFLISIGYVQQSNDECLFIKWVGSTFSIISTHVDDILQVATDEALVAELHTKLIQQFGHITFSPNAEAYLGMSIKRSADKREITLTQRGLIDKILETYTPDLSTTKRDPHSDKIFLSTDTDTRTNPKVDSKLYLGLVMSLMYLARLTRPDIILSVVHLATKSHCCTQNEMQEAYNVCKYLNGTKDEGITVNCSSLQLHCVCDASFNTHTDGASHTGFMVTLGPNLSYLHSRSAKQKLIAQSSTDAEVLAMVECLKMAVWIRNIIRDLNITPLEQIVIYQDNKSAIIMVEEDSKNKRSKHILYKIGYCRQLHKLGALDVRYLCTGEMTADMLTKPLHGELYNKHKATLMGIKR